MSNVFSFVTRPCQRILCACSSDNQVLLLLRSGKHNASTWGLPGGNVEAGDRDLQATAEREATEELGHLPEYSISSSVLTKCVLVAPSTNLKGPHLPVV